MKILFHTHEFNLNEGGPCTKRIDSLATYIAEQGHEVKIITSSHNKINEKNINKKYKVYYSYSTKKIKGTNLKRFLNNIIFGITSFFKSFFLGKIDILITTSPPPLISIFGFLIAKSKRAKLVYDVRDIWPDIALEMESFSKDTIYYKIFNSIAQFMYKHSDYITTVTEGKVEKIKGYVKNKEKVKYISNGLDDSFVNFEINDKLIKQYNLKEKFTVVYIGNVGLAQNLDAMIELAKENSNIQFLIFGEGAYKKNIEDRIESIKLQNIKLPGKIDYKMVYTVLKYAKISFISLKNNKMTDSVPTKIFDALGIGCPVLLYASGESCNILDKTGLGEHADNLEDLKTKFQYMVNNYEKYIQKKDFSIKFTHENFSRSKFAKSFVELVIEEKRCDI